VSRDIIVIGASAGGVEVLVEIARHLPIGFPASVFVVIHIPTVMRSRLAEILTETGPLPATQVVSSETIECGRIYVAPPDYHLLIEDGRVSPWRGPKEDRHRPAINPLFRSAAVAYGSRVIGVILSGALSDGSAGLWWIKHNGGIAVVQNPESAAFPDMPLSALDHVDADYIAEPPEIGPLLAKLVGTSATIKTESQFGAPSDFE
jgi:two-component system chemotaxis response regulator CheB